VYPTTPVSGSGIDVDKVPASVNVVDVIQIECIRSPNITNALQTALRSALRSTSTGFLRAKNPLTCRSTSEPSLEAPPPQAPDDYLTTRFSLCSASDRQRRRRMAMARRAWLSASKKGAQPSFVSARFLRKDKDLAGINTIWISDLVPVRFVNDGVSHARAVGDTADAPEAVARGYDRGRYLGRDRSGR
jgi:hypothetical protein